MTYCEQIQHPDPSDPERRVFVGPVAVCVPAEPQVGPVVDLAGPRRACVLAGARSHEETLRQHGRLPSVEDGVAVVPEEGKEDMCPSVCHRSEVRTPSTTGARRLKADDVNLGLRGDDGAPDTNWCVYRLYLNPLAAMVLAAGSTVSTDVTVEVEVEVEVVVVTLFATAVVYGSSKACAPSRRSSRPGHRRRI
ncbi:hypothetical protein DL766_005293 [Monosporascus sp. MC13-8B]|nr:hypothetical protein DL763_010171 [Monosporascus cannonballus]RYP29560.1 hypothetical protein DL766_005293 [Monosporascus sp. MC13-8B]